MGSGLDAVFDYAASSLGSGMSSGYRQRLLPGERAARSCGGVVPRQTLTAIPHAAIALRGLEDL